MKIKFLFLLFNVFIYLNAQTIVIDWQGTKDYVTGIDEKSVLPFFSNEGYSVQGNIPQLSYIKKTTQVGRVLIQNIQYSSLSDGERGQLNVSDIPEKIEYSAKVSKGIGGYTISVRLIPFIKENNQVKKVTSFQIVHQQGFSLINETDDVFDPATQSVLRSGDWYKIKLDKSGVFRLDKSFFDQNNIPTNFDPRTLKIYGNGGRMLNENPGDFRYGALQENTIEFIGQEDGSFDGGDYILFYAQGPHEWNRLLDSTLSDLTHRFNQYSDYAYYFITYGGELGKRIQEVTIDEIPTQIFTTYDEYIFYEKDSLSVSQTGKQWGGEPFTVMPDQSFTLVGKGSVASDFYAKAQLIGRDASGVSANINVNGISIGSGTFGAGTFVTLTKESTIATTGNTFDFSISISDAVNPGSFIFLDYLEVKYRANLVFNGLQMKFRQLQNLNDGNVYGFALSGAQKVWDISDITTVKQVSNVGGVYKYKSNSPYFLNELVAFNESAAFTEIEYVGTINNQNIRALNNIDYAIVAHPSYIGEASRLANFRTKHDNVKVAVVTTEQIYNEFSSGAQDVSAIRDFFKHLRDSGSPLRYVLLFGGASYDYKDRIADNTNFVPTYISFVSTALDNLRSEADSFATDDFFTMIDDTDIIMSNTRAPSEFSSNTSSQMDLAVGRFPAHNLTEAKIMVDKTLAYYEQLPSQGTSFGDWKTKFYLFVDDDDAFHEDIESTTATYISDNIDYAYLKKGYVDAFVQESSSAGARYPQVNQLISNAFNLGSAFINYFGHGGPRSWTQERIITLEEINNFSNFSGLYSRLPVVMTITCEFTVWDLPHLPSAGVYMFKVPEGGAVAMITTSRPVGVGYGKGANDIYVKELLNIQGNQYQTIGEAMTHAKANGLAGRADNLNVNLLGDPMIRIVRPPREIRITKINGEDADTFSGTLRAMDFVEIEGEVLDENGTTRDNSFNGKASATLFDKPVNKSTLNNDGDIGVMNFQEQVNAIFRGGTNVNYGQFKFQFYVPKDINYEVGDGRLTVYAHNNVVDGVTSKSVKVGDQNPEGLNDDEGPTIGLYMNNLNFVDGGITDRNPYLLACLTDSVGINVSGIAIGHDLTGILDQNVEGTYVLNEYYEGGDNNPCVNPQVFDYQKGQVVYRLADLELGEHQITFKAWDINNNSSEQTLDFVVMEEGSNSIYIDKLLNWPNPFTNQTYFHFEHNCDSELEVMVQIFTVSG
ncbi:MAG: type IX secretion system sortase PorU, partial [Moheibacter sp.]